MEGTIKGESSPRHRMHRGQGGAGDRMVSGNNEHQSRCHSKEHQHLRQIKEVVEQQHQKKTKGSGREKRRVQNLQEVTQVKAECQKSIQ